MPVRSPESPFVRPIAARLRGALRDAIAALAGDPIPRSAAMRDIAFLAIVVAASALLYVRRLGFYSDDWAFLGSMHSAKDQSLRGYFAALDTDNMRCRPMQALYLAALYDAFGLRPAGYHAVNLLVLVLGIVFLYLVLRALGVRRDVAVSVPLVYAFLPSYSTDRFWYSAAQAMLTMLLTFAGAYADLRALASPSRIAATGWRAAGCLCAGVVALAYEVFVPLQAVKWLLIRRLRPATAYPAAAATGSRSGLPFLAFLVPDLLALTVAAAFKIAVNERESGAMGPLRRLLWTGWVYLHAIRQHIVQFGAGLPRLSWHAIRDHLSAAELLYGLGLAALCLWYLWVVARGCRRPPGRAAALGAAAVGGVLFVAGYAVFVATDQIQFVRLGISNRTAIAGALGAAFLGVALALLMDSLRRRSSGGIGRTGFCLTVTAIVFAGWTVLASEASDWAQAWSQQQTLLSHIAQDLPPLPRDGALLLDGACPYVGPGIVFDSNWDLAGALKIYRPDAPRLVDVVAPTTEASAAGVTTVMYGKKASYPFPNVFVYDAARRRVIPLPDEAAARVYLNASPNHGDTCPAGQPGAGVDDL